eukprot:253958_1
MSLHKVIEFNVLLNTLNPEEFDSFFSELTTVCGKRETITKSLFHLLVHENQHNSNVYESNANRIVKNLIENREPNEDPRPTLTPIYPVLFNNIPAIMVSACASYLQLSEVTSFSLCNRHSYMSCKSIPTSITSMLNLSWLDNYCCNYGKSPQLQSIQLQKLHQFRRIKHLIFPEHSLHDVPLQHWNWFCLDTFTLIETQLQPFDDILLHVRDIITQTNVKHLHFDKMQCIGITFFELFEFICVNKNIEYLTLRDLSYLDHSYEPADILIELEISETNVLKPLSSLSKLKGIALNENDMCQDNEWRLILANHLSKQLQSLHIHPATTAYHKDSSLCVHSWNDHDYSNLQELCVSGINSDQISNIVETATQLKRFHVSLDPRQTMITEENTKLLKTVLSREHIEYLSITVPFLHEPIFQLIKILNGTDIPKRNCFKLRLDTTNRIDIPSESASLYGLDPEIVGWKMLKVLHITLESLVTKDFMLWIQFRLDSVFGERIHNGMKIVKQIDNEDCQMYLSTNISNVCYYGDDGQPKEEEF